MIRKHAGPVSVRGGPDLGPVNGALGQAGRALDVAAFRRGDPAAFRAVIEQHESLLRGIVTRYARDPDDQEDLHQEMCIRIWQQRGRYKEQGKMAAWIATLASNHAENWLASRRLRESTLQDYQVVGLPLETAQTMLSDPDRLLRHTRFMEKLQRALEQLPERQREVMELIAVKGFKPTEAARELGIPAPSARSNLRHARDKLRTLMGDARDELS